MSPARSGSGRKVIPINIKKAKGTYRKERDKHAPAPSIKKPFPPRWLNKRAKQIFWHMAGRLNEIGMATATHTEIMAVLSSRMEELERFDKMLNEGAKVEISDPKTGKKEIKTINGYVYATSNSFGDPILKENPAVALRERAAKHVHSLLVEFGLTPSAAQKVGPGKRSEKGNEFEEF